MIVIVTGPRDWTDRETIYAVLDQLLTEHTQGGGDPSTFILRHGVAEGVDWIANDWGKERGVTVERFPAQWRDQSGYNPAAGPIRNKTMAKAEPRADLVLAFWHGKLRVKFGKREYSGTLDMIQAALAEGLEVRVVPPRKSSNEQ